MEIKILQVFLGADGLPYKDQERTVHFPIVGSGFQGASNTTKIRFYYDELVEEDDTETAWVACAKLPNGKIGSKVLETDYDSTLGEHYALLELDSFYFQYKGDVYISLQGYQGGVQVDYDEETELYTIYGTPTIAATGSIKLSVNYATQFVGSGETSNVNFQRILADLGTKLGIRATSVFVEELPTVGNPDTFYVIHNDLSDPNKANIYIWNSVTEHYIWVGDNTLDLGNYYTKAQGEQFENGIYNRITSVENELESVASGSPKGVYATLAALQAAYPTGADGIYVVSADGHWYYWSGSAWTDGGVYLSNGTDIEDLEDRIDEMEDAVFEIVNTQNKFDINGLINNSYWNGTSIATNNSYAISNVIKVDRNFNYIKFSYNGTAKAISSTYYCNEDGTIYEKYDAGLQTVTISNLPNTVQYVRFLFNKASNWTEGFDKAQIELTRSNQLTPYIPYSIKVSKVKENKENISYILNNIGLPQKDMKNTIWWCLGMWDRANNRVSFNKPRITSLGFFAPTTDTEIKVNDGARVLMFKYNIDGTFVTQENYENDFLLKTGYKYKFTMYMISIDSNPQEAPYLYPQDNPVWNNVMFVSSENYNGVDVKKDIPSWYDTQIETVEPQIIDKLRNVGNNKSSFIFTTDCHWGANAKHSIPIIAKLLNDTNLNTVFDGGDIITDHFTTKDLAYNELRDFQDRHKGMNFYGCIGNHDTNASAQTVPAAILTNKEVYYYINEQSELKITKYDNYFSYYLDNLTDKTRYVFLSTGIRAMSNDDWNFVIDALISVDTNWKVIIISHTWKDSGSVTTSATQLLELIDNYNSKTSGSISGISYDFSNAKGTVPFCVGGHIHADDIIYSTNNVPVVICDCDAYSNNTNYLGTTNEQCVTVFIADYSNNKLHCYRIGRGSSFEVNL